LREKAETPTHSDASRRRATVRWTPPIVVALGLTLLAAAWAWGALTGATKTLSPGESVDIVGSDLAVTVPAGWTGETVTYVWLPDWAGGRPLTSDALGRRQDITINSTDSSGRMLTVMVFEDEDEWARLQSRFEDSASSQELVLDGTPFDGSDWNALSGQTPQGVWITIDGTADRGGLGVHVMLYSTRVDETAQGLVEYLDQISQE